MSVSEVLNGGQAHVSSEVKAPKANGNSPSSSPRLRNDAHRELPPGWERVHTDHGMYYWQKETGKTRWKFPEEEGKGVLFLPPPLEVSVQCLWTCS